MSQATTPVPPFADTPITDQGRFSTSWNQHLTDISDALANQTTQITDLQNQLTALSGSLGIGVVDGSDAAAGNVGEYLVASGSGVALANNVAANVATLNLTAGDWDVSGQVSFNAGSGTHVYFGGGIGGLDTVTFATFPSTAITPEFGTATRRYSLTATTAVSVVAQAGFTGTVTVSGTIRARRMR